jgi:ubiquinone/menaquinone biosynthesis C-methylase UbiE
MANQQGAEEYSFLVGFEGDWRDTWWNADFLELMARRWKLGEARRVLDVGCGVGHWGRTLLPFLHAEARVSGVDVEASFAEKASAKAAELGIAERTDYRAARVEELPFEDGTFDLVTCQTVLIHVADVPKALREMMRVLKPGGMIAVAEPDNLAESITFLRGSPAPAWSDVLALLDFQHTCEAGKQALGHGNSSVGDLLPGMFARAGLREIAVYQSDRSPALFPPYRTREQAIDLRQFLGWIDAGICLIGGGTREDAEKLYRAGGGDPERFDALFQLALAHQQRFKQAVLAGTYDGGRAITCYLVSGRKP